MKKKFDFYSLILATIVTIVLLVVHILWGGVNLGINNLNTLVILPISLIFYLLVSYDLFIEAFKKIKHKQFFDEVTLSLIATIAAFAIGEYVEALAVVVFFQIGERFEKYAVDKSRNSIKSILNLRPDKVTLYNNEIEKVVEPFDVNIGDHFIVKSGERVPIDGKVIKGKSTLDTSSMTGESIPRSIKEGEEVISGVINLGSPLIIEATKEFYNSTISKMLDLVENASSQKANSEKFITKFAKIYTPIVIFLAVIVAILPPLIINYSDPATWANYIRTAASFLVISCPCALVLSVPMSYFVSLGEASKNKVLIKGSTYLDKFTKLNNIVLDKTGTITKGNFVINEIKTQDDFDKNELLMLAQYGEYYSNHPIALAIIQDKKDTLDKNLLTNYQEIEGRGVKVNYNNKELLVGNAKLLKENSIEFINIDSPFTLIYVAYDHKYLGYIEIKDQIKETSINAIKNYHKNRIKNVVMLTGDNDKIAEAVSKEAGVDKYYANLLPLDKTSKLEEIIKSEGKVTTAFVGDGINDAPSLTKADIGISMGGIGSDITIDSSDVVIMDDDLNNVNKVIKIAKKNKLVVIENITFAILVKVLVMILSLIPNLPITPYIMWFAIFADVGVTVICVLNSLRLSLNFKKLNK